MLPDRKFTTPSPYLPNSNYRPQPQQTPRAKNKPQVPLPNSRRSVTPSRVQDRMASSPLRVPLQCAIEKCVREKSLERTSRSRVLNRSSRRDDSSIIRRNLLDEEDQTRKAHPQTVQFVKSYFDFDSPIPLQHFIDRVVQRYENLWQNQDVDLVLEHFGNKVADIFGSEAIEPRDLMSFTRENGMIGFILHVFRLINEAETPVKTQTSSRFQRSAVNFSRSPNMQSINRSFQQQLSECVKTQDLKNIIQEFMELMYKEMEGEIYAKFNVEMRRMVLKFREAEKMVKKVEENMVMHADYYEAEKLWKAKSRTQEEEKIELKKRIEKMEEELKKEKEANVQIRNHRTKLQEDNSKLRENLQKYQNILINKFQALPNNNNDPNTPVPAQSRRLMATPLADRTQDFNSQNNMYKEPQPFQIKIDTHFIQREHGPPMIQNTTAFMENTQPPFPPVPNNMSYSPIKMESSRPSLEGGIKPGTKIGDFTYSPYHSRIARPF